VVAARLSAIASSLKTLSGAALSDAAGASASGFAVSLVSFFFTSCAHTQEADNAG
jgi:hypothetical protein